MAKRTAVAKAVDDISEAVPHLIRLPQKKAWIDYDEEADVLYISLKRPQKATDTKLFALGRERYPATLSRQGTGRRNCLGCLQAAARKQTPRLNTLAIRVNKF